MKNRHIICFHLLFFLCCSFVSSRPAMAGDVVILKSSFVMPQEKVIEGFKSTCDCSALELSIDNANIRDLKARIHNTKVRAIFAIGSDALDFARQFKSIPIFYTLIVIPEMIIADQKNIYGVKMLLPPEQYVNSIAELFPDVKRIGVIFNPLYFRSYANELKQIAKSRGIDTVYGETENSADVSYLFDGMRNKIDMFLMLPDRTIFSAESIKYIFLLSFQHKIPVFSFSKKYVDMGAVAALDISLRDLGAQTGVMSKKILLGEAYSFPSHSEAKKSSLILNVRMIKKLGMEVKGQATNMKMTNGAY